ncbi:helix-turn-helix transcriptional regulator [Umezawaea tangerina]|uniref:DNA-binding NarL/FixJ family response regulator n=1 Tax=Umezawaea tangerina TaxID=84725 RepID=A0A2T0SP27_9PSEU|nr:response regulator transcription factor [Umezawaea tangerina]PRY35168.1 DNA-binding NarL/FixJ family response regulator [Umezawaea tangerina]
MARVRVVVHSTDPMTYVGLTSYLKSRPEMVIVDKQDAGQADVAVFSTERLTSEAMNRLRALAAERTVPTVLMAGALTEAPLLAVVECGVVAILPRSAVTGEQLVDSIMAAAAGNGVMPRDILGKLLKRVEMLQREVLAPNGLNVAGLEPREVDVLRLIAEGWGTDEIAKELQYSERTVKNVIYNVTNRLKLRNRAHAVAYALRAGVI